MRANGTPLSAYSLALDYNVKGWFFNLTGNYYDRVYIDFSSYRRLGSVLDKNGAGVDANGNPVLNVPGQEKLDGGFMLDASIGKYIRLRNGIITKTVPHVFTSFPRILSISTHSRSMLS